MSSYSIVNFATHESRHPGSGEQARTKPDAGERARTELPVRCRRYIKPDSPAHSRITDGNSVV
jgi:hypothetical protein